MEEDFLEQTRGKTIDLVVCSDAEAILGIGDQGVGVIDVLTLADRACADETYVG
jgi:malate dehydrogenase (oxaloacetate-decarboxylating)